MEDYDNFDSKKYLDNYPDLIQNGINTKDKAFDHYMKYGRIEKRIFYKYHDNLIPTDFNWLDYINLNRDLINITNENDAIYHYLNHGIKENRIYNYPENFNWIKYITYYKDLSNIKNKYDAYYHYYYNGIKENRTYFLLKNNNIKILNSKNAINYIPDITNYKNNIIVSLSSIPNRFLSDIFNEVIESINNQIIKPKYIIVNLCKIYKRDFIYDINLFNEKINYLKNKY